MARAQSRTTAKPSLYERDFYLWVEEQARLLRQGSFERLDIANLVEEIEDLGVRGRRPSRAISLVLLGGRDEGGWSCSCIC